MDETKLMWTPIDRRTVFTTRIFDVDEITSRSPEGDNHRFFSLEAADWVIVVPVIHAERGEESFLMVRQWRHGAREMSLEFPGGVMNEGETPEAAAMRELAEETGYAAGTMRYACAVSPNPAIMGNHCHFFIATDLIDTGHRNPDEDEYIGVETIAAREVFAAMGKPPYIHALMQSALFAYVQTKGLQPFDGSKA